MTFKNAFIIRIIFLLYTEILIETGQTWVLMILVTVVELILSTFNTPLTGFIEECGMQYDFQISICNSVVNVAITVKRAALGLLCLQKILPYELTA